MIPEVREDLESASQLRTGLSILQQYSGGLLAALPVAYIRTLTVLTKTLDEQIERGNAPGSVGRGKIRTGGERTSSLEMEAIDALEAAIWHNYRQGMKMPRV